MVEYIKNVLTQEGIGCMVKNSELGGAVGELPPLECWPEVWVLEDDDYARARDIVAGLCRDRTGGRCWTCRCGETLEAQFAECWRCGRARCER